MKIPQESNEAFNITAVGSWNPAIFTPQWVKTHLATDQSKDVVLAIPVQMMTYLPPRITVDAVNIYPSPQSLMVDCVTYSDEVLPVCVEKLQKLCNLLSHTPITALGINFRFYGQVDESAALADLFTFADAGRINAGKYASATSAIRRSFRLGDSDFLNLTAELYPEFLRMDFNFHCEVTSAADVSAKVTSESIRAKKKDALEFLAIVYNVEVEI